jgi:hypothetical protein
MRRSFNCKGGEEMDRNHFDVGSEEVMDHAGSRSNRDLKKQAPCLKRVSFATPISQVMGEHAPAIPDDGCLILPGTTPLFNESIFSCDPMLFESRLYTIVETAQHPTPLPSHLDASSQIMEMSIPSHKDWEPPTKALKKNLQGGTTTLVDEDEEAMHPTCSAVEPVHNLREAVDVADGKASSLGASLGGGIQKLVVDLGHTDLHGNGWESVNDQNTTPSRLQEPVIPQFPSKVVEIELNSTSPQDPTTIAKEITIDGFLASISKFVPTPLIPQLPVPTLEEERNDHEMGNTSESPQTPPPPRPSFFTPQRKSIRLAKKSKTTQGKGAIQVAEELLIKKLGDLSPSATKEEADQFEFFAQHLERPLTKANMDAITVLIEVGQQKNKKRGKLTIG